jgi:predicted transcriptional regulator
MVTYRTQVRIVADVLLIIKNNNNHGGVGVTTILRKGNMSYSRLNKLLGDLVKSGLIIQVTEERGSRYSISDKGLNYLQVYTRFEEFASAFGVRL